LCMLARPLPENTSASHPRDEWKKEDLHTPQIESETP